MYTNLAYKAYETYQPAGKDEGFLPLVEGGRVLEIGIGNLALLRALRDRGNDVHGIDVGRGIVERGRAAGFENLHLLDVSEAPLPYTEDYFDAVYCYEVFEHLTNPHRLFYEIRRVLKFDHMLFFSVPCQETDMGYGEYRHPFVYPGLLVKEHLERFIMQMYFQIEYCFEPPGRLVGRSYILRNRKSETKPDIVEVVPSDNTVQALYGDVLSPDRLEQELARETGEYLRMMREDAEQGNWQAVAAAFGILAAQYRDYYPIYIEVARIMAGFGQAATACKVCDSVLARPEVPPNVHEVVRALRVEFSNEPTA